MLHLKEKVDVFLLALFLLDISIIKLIIGDQHLGMFCNRDPTRPWWNRDYTSLLLCTACCYTCLCYRLSLVQHLQNQSKQ